MEVALPFVAHMAFLMVGLGSLALGVLLLTRSVGAGRFLAAPLLLVIGVWLFYRVIVRL